MFRREKEIAMTPEELKVNVEKALEEIRPFLQSDGGDISLVSIDNENSVKVRLQGACVGCTVNQMTLKSGVEMTIKKYAPQIEEVVNVG
ncbi:Fe-S cluster biogenesis protein NfuA, 4Fe-4S-binding domain [Kriegella aquimaris]|uniref:Fe-S cluster biogenesis protein NfuA, 4Fe-4S-binding domain n=2 Tax=Kriegella aquimaris TaxID=192904 RepID=A0A1G9M6V6_9FLAO|nr:Fe-S cluster biogenesis protein NfuA, 4Fe-4S-binding domain [Kriegella aquimaris]